MRTEQPRCVPVSFGTSKENKPEEILKALCFLMEKSAVLLHPGAVPDVSHSHIQRRVTLSYSQALRDVSWAISPPLSNGRGVAVLRPRSELQMVGVYWC